MERNLIIRNIAPQDNEILAKVIRRALIEFGGEKPGTAYHDYDTDHMFEAYQGKGQNYYVAEYNGELVGGSGIKQLQNESNDVCELQKLYLNKEIRGLGIGQLLLEKCIEFARKIPYKKCYLETFPNMVAAINLYKKNGFYIIDKPMGDTGHCGCDVWMVKDL